MLYESWNLYIYIYLYIYMSFWCTYTYVHKSMNICIYAFEIITTWIYLKHCDAKCADRRSVSKPCDATCPDRRMPTTVASCSADSAAISIFKLYNQRQPANKRMANCSAGSAVISTQIKTRGKDKKLLPTNIASCSADCAETFISKPELKVRGSCRQT